MILVDGNSNGLIEFKIGTSSDYPATNFHFEKTYNPGKAQDDMGDGHNNRFNFIMSLLILSLMIFTTVLAFGINPIKYMLTPNFILSLIAGWAIIIFIVGIMYPYWKVYLFINNEVIKIRNPYRKPFPYYVPITEYNFESELKILYTPYNKVARFKQNNRKVVTLFTGLDESEIRRIFDFLEKKDNVKITVLRKPEDQKTRAQNYFAVKNF